MGRRDGAMDQLLPNVRLRRKTLVRRETIAELDPAAGRKFSSPAKLESPKPIGENETKQREKKPMKSHYRIVVMGSARVGKTCIISQFLYDKFINEYKRTIEELHRGEYEINGKQLTLDILDTSGAYEFPAMRKLSISTSDAFVLVYAVDDESSFEELKTIRQQIIEEKNNDGIPIVIVANKSDINISSRTIARHTTASTVSIEWGNGFVEASAKEGYNIVGIFKELLAQAKVHYALSPAVKKRRESLPSFSTTPTKQKRPSERQVKRNSCMIS